jgi:Protein-disulfide isomerase
MNLKRLVLPLLSAIALSASYPSSATELQRSDVEKIVREYLLAHPEILLDMSNNLRNKQEADQEKADIALLKQYRDEIFNNPADPVGGNPKGTLTIVEFFDYNCGYCKRAKPLITEVVAENKEVRYIYKEFPILTETSFQAAKISLAIQKLHPDHYQTFHNSLMEKSTPVKDEAELAKAVVAAGMKWDEIKKKSQDPAIEQQLMANHQLAQQLNLTGTPAFIIGETVLRGAPRSADDIRTLLKK